MKRILVVEDEKIYQMMLYHALQPLGVEVEIADSGERGLELALLIKPDLIITDVVMSGMTGYEMVRTLRRNTHFASLPVLVLTAQSELDDKLEAFEAGADDYMTKPFEPAELLARINVMLRHSEAISRSIESTGMAQRPAARVIALHGLRGGVGCSTLAVNLGLALTRVTNGSVLVMDLVLTAGQVALMLNKPLKRTWADLVKISPSELDWDALKTIIGNFDSRLSLIAAPTFPTDVELLTPELFTKAFQILQSKFDYIVVDLPHDFTGPVIGILDAAHVILSLMAPELASLRAAVAAVEIYNRLEYPPEKVMLIVNWIFERKGLRRKSIELALHRSVDLVLPYVPDYFVEAINQGKPVILERPNDKISATFTALAQLICK